MTIYFAYQNCFLMGNQFRPAWAEPNLNFTCWLWVRLFVCKPEFIFNCYLYMFIVRLSYKFKSTPNCFQSKHTPNPAGPTVQIKKAALIHRKVNRCLRFRWDMASRAFTYINWISINDSSPPKYNFQLPFLDPRDTGPNWGTCNNTARFFFRLLLLIPRWKWHFIDRLTRRRLNGKRAKGNRKITDISPSDSTSLSSN